MQRFPALLLASCALLTACADRTPLTPDPAAVPPANVQQRFECKVYVREQRVTCAPPAAGTSPVRGAIIGGQGEKVRITASNVLADSVAHTVSFDVTVQNLLPYAMGTLDGVNPDPAGLRVFFHQGPAVTSGWGNVTVQNADGVGVFTAANQPYFQYPGILGPTQTTAPKNWQFHLDPDVAHFAFTLLVATHTAPTLVISEIMAHPSTASEAAGEWFEVHNLSADPIDLQGWTIASGGDAPHTITSSVVVPRNGYVVLGGSTDPAANGNANVQYAYSGVDLANGTGDWLSLRSPAGFTADSVDWGAATGETASPPPTGSSLELDSLQNDNTFLSGASSHWVPAARPFGTGQLGSPGVARPVPLNAVSVAAGSQHSCAVDTSGQAWCWGDNRLGQLGTGDTLPLPRVPQRVRQPAGVSFTQVVTGAVNSCALATTGQAYCWGSKVPVGTGEARRTTAVPIPLPSGVTFTSLSELGRRISDRFGGCGIDASGQAWCWGETEFTPTLLPTPAPVAQISVGDWEMCLRSTTGNVYCRTVGFGADTFVAVTQPGVTFQWVETTASRGCGISTLGQLMCWAAPTYTVGIVDHPSSVRFTQVELSGTQNLCALATSGQAYCQGVNNWGQLGDGTQTPRTTLTPVAQPPGVLFSQISMSDVNPNSSGFDDHGCALRQGSGQVYCWGSNQYGAIGDGSAETRRLAPVPIFR